MGMPVMKGGSSQINDIPTSPLQVFRQQKQFSKKFENQISRRHSYKFGDTIDPYSPDVAPMNIFKKI